MGFTAFVLMVPLALTSTKGWIRRLGRRVADPSSPDLCIGVCAAIHFLWKVKVASGDPVCTPLSCWCCWGSAWWTGSGSGPFGRLNGQFTPEICQFTESPCFLNDLPVFCRHAQADQYVEKGLTVAAKGAWAVFDALNSIKPNAAFTPKWSDLPLQKSWQKVKPPLGWPRETDSLCPNCVREARQAIVDGKQDYKILLNEKVGEIKADDHREGRQDRDDQGLPDPRALRRRDGDGPGVLQAPRGSRSRAATSARTTTRSSTTTAAARSSTAAARS